MPGSAWSILVSVLEPGLVGSHGAIYTDAARAWLTGGNPWTVGPPAAVFAGPPSMLLPFAPFAPLVSLAPFAREVVALTWVAIALAGTLLVLRRLGLPAYWLIFPPIFEGIVLGHPEILVLLLLTLRSPLSGLSILIKPYAAFPLVAERRWTALGLAAVAVAVTLPFLPWSLFVSELTTIAGTLARQNAGDSVFGQPILMVIGVIALVAIGWRRGLWLAVPVLWPSAQPIYKVASVPMLSPVIALFWALPIPGATLAGVVAQAVLAEIGRRRTLPKWLKDGLEPVAEPPADRAPALGRAPIAAVSA